MKHQKYTEWKRLENASKIFPAIWNDKDPKVFRISCELFDVVEPEALQSALNKTIDDFPLYKSVLKRGLFWYYLELSDIQPVVKIESNTICAPIYIGLRNNLLFRVFYYNNRINLEVFHALSDGAGALRFLQTLIFYYLHLVQKETFKNIVFEKDQSSISEQMDDSFGKHFIGGNKKDENKKTQGDNRAYQIRGTSFADKRTNVIEGSMSTKCVLDEAHKHQTTLTVFISALYSYAIYKDMSARKRRWPIVLTVPVNLRPYFKSVTARNFFSYINVGHDYSQGTADLNEVIQSISESFRKNLTLDQLTKQTSKHMAMEQNIFSRVVPLPVKNFIIRRVVNYSDKQTTTNVSNIGKISMQSELTPYIRQFSVYTSARRPQMTLCSYGDRLVVSITSPFQETDIQRTFFQLLSKRGIEIEISSNI